MKKYIALYILACLTLVGLAFYPGGGATTTSTSGYSTGESTAYSCVVYNYSVYGSTDTKVPKFGHTLSNTGDGIVWNYTTNNVNGSSWLILRTGTYALMTTFSAEDPAPAAVELAWVTNSADKTVNAVDQDPTNTLNYVYAREAAVTPIPSCPWVGILTSNTTLNVITDATAPGFANKCRAIVTFIK